MQRVTIVRYTAKPGRADENERLARAVFADLRKGPRQAIAYALLRDGDDFLHLFLNLETDDAEGVVGLPSFRSFAADAGDRWVAPAVTTRHAMAIVESYGFEATLAPA